jgi:hypothetical protein
VRNFGFEIPVDYRERGQVERGVRNPQHPDPARDGKDRSEHQPRDRSLFGTSQPLRAVHLARPNWVFQYARQRLQSSPERSQPQIGLGKKHEHLAQVSPQWEADNGAPSRLTPDKPDKRLNIW